MTREEAIKQITDILEYFNDRIERETDPAFDKEIAKKDAEALRMASKALEQGLCEDAISRQAVWDVMQELWGTSGELLDRLMALPPVTPQSKTGHWITKPHVYGVTYCSECDFELKIDDTNFCPNCGAKMESEDK